MNIKTSIITFILLGINFFGCKEENKIEIKKKYQCSYNINALNIDSLPLYKYNSFLEDFIHLKTEPNVLNLYGKISSIHDVKYEIKNMFDEDKLIPIEESFYYFNENQRLIKKNLKSLNGKNQNNTHLYTYSAKDKLIKEESISSHFKEINLFDYTVDGKLLSKTSNSILDRLNFNGTNFTKIYSIDSKITYEYNKFGRVEKEIITNKLNQDSSVVKYIQDESFQPSPYQVIVYNSRGSRDFIINLNTDNINNTFALRTWKINLPFGDDFKDENLKSEIIVYFNENCKVTKVTKVEMSSNNMKTFSKIEFNEKGDLILFNEFEYPKNSENDFDLSYLNNFKNEFQINEIFMKYNYDYDKFGNWIKLRYDNFIINRELTYQ